MRVKWLSAAASLMVGLPSASFALGLGEIQLKSTLNAPLNAEIELLGATPEELSGLRAQLASRETFTRYGLDYPSFLSGVQVRFTRTADNRPVIELRSSQPITGRSRCRSGLGADHRWFSRPITGCSRRRPPDVSRRLACLAHVTRRVDDGPAPVVDTAARVESGASSPRSE